MIWHDFETLNWSNCGTTAPAVKEVLGEQFKNVYLIDNRQNICGIYIPEKFQQDFEYHEIVYTEERQPMWAYELEAIVHKKD